MLIKEDDSIRPGNTNNGVNTLHLETPIHHEYCHPESSRDLSALGYFDIKNKLRIEPVSVHPRYGILSPPKSFVRLRSLSNHHHCTQTLSILRDRSKTRRETSEGVGEIPAP